MNSRPRPEIIAHRGYSARAPENTMAAFEAALRVGSDAVEFDVQVAACGTPVVFHDTMLGRTTDGVGPLRRRPLAHLRELDAGSWFGAGFAGQTIPTQEEALALLAGKVPRIYQDLKGYREMEDLDRMVEVTHRTGTEGATVFVSSDWVILNRLRQVAPHVPRAYLVDKVEVLPNALDRAFVDEGSFLSVEVGLALTHPGEMREALEKAVEMVVWTVDDPAQATLAWEMGIHRITTNRVEDLLAWRGELA